MFDFGQAPIDPPHLVDDVVVHGVRSTAKACFDLAGAVLLMVPLCIAAVCLLVLNPLFNAGPLMFTQSRMGQDCHAFTAYKFRTMSLAKSGQRGAFDKLEHDRVSRMGRLMRKSRIDELPQIINVLRGDMSLIGPRPDSFEHACVYLRHVPGYAKRHQLLPGISGYAQTEVGYVEGFADMQRKVEADLYYLDHASFRFDLWITWRTICVVFGRKGS